MRKQLIPILILLGSLVGLVAWSLLTGRATPRPITTCFLGYTNNGAAGRLAMFAVSNSSPTSYLELGHYGIQVSEPNGRGAWIRGTNAFGTFLPARDCRVVTVPGPARGPWRASLTCCLIPSGDTPVSIFLEQASEMGFPTRYRNFEVWSDWIAK